MGGTGDGGGRLMAGQGDGRAANIVIVRRRGHGEDDHHHGGVWKIAYADFMTAMMAFFLVMWLINAANTETKASVASYFNPIKLTDNVARKKGLRDLDEKANASEKQKAKDAKAKKDGKSPGAEGAGSGRANGAVDVDAAPKMNEMGKGDPAPGPTRDAGRTFLDPYTPLSAARILAREREEAGSQSTGGTASGGSAHTEAARDSDSAGRTSSRASDLLGGIEGAVRELGLKAGPGIDVAVEGDTLVLSLTDTSNFGMFAVGSAEPNGELVKLLKSITPLLAAHGDRIIVRGHTDSRPYRSGARDNNWRLALARAEAAYAMLLKSGIEEVRFDRIEAYADRKLKNAANPEDAANRRIEIVLRKGGRTP